MTLERAGAELTALGWPASKQTVSHYETGRNLPDPLVLRKLCRLYNVTADSLLWGADDADRPDNAGLDPALAERLARATPDQRALVRQLIITTLDGLHVPAAPLEKPRRGVSMGNVYTLPHRRPAAHLSDVAGTPQADSHLGGGRPPLAGAECIHGTWGLFTQGAPRTIRE